jgi:hypothetical protein
MRLPSGKLFKRHYTLASPVSDLEGLALTVVADTMNTKMKPPARSWIPPFRHPQSAFPVVWVVLPSE